MFSGGVGCPPCRGEVRERAREGDVVDVVAGHVRERPVLTPAGHAAVDEARIALQAHVGTEPEALGDSGAKRLHERVGRLDHPEHARDAVGVLQVDGHRPPAARRDGVGSGAAPERLGAVDAHDLRPHVGEELARERPRADAAELDDLDTLERSHACLLVVARREATGVGYQDPPPPPPPPPPENPPPENPDDPLEPEVDGGVDTSVPALATVKLLIAPENAR